MRAGRYGNLPVCTPSPLALRVPAPKHAGGVPTEEPKPEFYLSLVTMHGTLNFSIVTVAITVPFAVLGMNLIASLWRAEIRLSAAMLFALGLTSAVGIGGLGGLYLGTASADIYFHDTSSPGGSCTCASSASPWCSASPAASARF